jgi:hypothetical protein
MTMRSANMPMGQPTGCPILRLVPFTQALYDEAKQKSWTVISMKNDWEHIFAFE